MQYPADQRRPRNAFIPKIAQIVSRIEAAPTQRVRWKWDAIFGGGEDEATFSVMSLYVFGSFARGAPTCGDLDLLLVFAHADGLIPPERVVSSKFKGRLPNIDFAAVHTNWLQQKLERFPEAKLIWSPSDRDWRSRVAAIPVDNDVGRFARRTDQLPLALKQFDFHNLEHAEKVLDAIEARKLVSTWVPLEFIEPKPDTWDSELQRLAPHWADDLGRKSREVLPYVLQWMSTRLDTPGRTRYQERACVHVNDIHAHIGRPSLYVRRLLDIDVSTLVLAPHISRQFPRGLWILERGERHRCARAFADLSAWILGVQGAPIFVLYMRSSGHVDGTTGIELFRSRRRANAYLRTVHYDDDDDRGAPLEIAGHELLKMVCKLEVVMVGEHQLTVRGSAVEFAERLRVLLAPRLGKRAPQSQPSLLGRPIAVTPAVRAAARRALAKARARPRGA